MLEDVDLLAAGRVPDPGGVFNGADEPLAVRAKGHALPLDAQHLLTAGEVPDAQGSVAVGAHGQALAVGPEGDAGLVTLLARHQRQGQVHLARVVDQPGAMSLDEDEVGAGGDVHQGVSRELCEGPGCHAVAPYGLSSNTSMKRSAKRVCPKPNFR